MSNFNNKKQVKAQIFDAKNFINIEALYKENFFGKDVCVAIIDTGVSAMLDLCVPQNRIVFFKDFINDKVLPYDDNGHGTFISGVIGGNGLLSCGKYSGIAPLCNIVSLKALDANGEASSDVILKAMQWIVKNKKKFNIKVVCMSFGSIATFNDVLAYGANMLSRNGLVVVTAGGNDGPDYNTITSPGIAKYAITVGALSRLGKNLSVAKFSSRGKIGEKIVKPDILAPGTEIISLNNNIADSPYKKMSGTSVSTPIIAGVCVLLCEKYPHLTPKEIKRKLITFAVDIGENKYAQGKGAFIYS